PSNVDDQAQLKQIMFELDSLSAELTVIFPVHPRTRKMLSAFDSPLAGRSNLKLIDPIGYHDSLWLTENARLLLTDSGGLQEESTFLRTPCLTLRPNTERPITVQVGTNKLTCLERLAADIEEILQNRRSPGQVPLLWDGHTAERIVKCLLEQSSGVTNQS